jgi:ATP-dependent exoDNAse (exonuclease V) alpha subunit
VTLELWEPTIHVVNRACPYIGTRSGRSLVGDRVQLTAPARELKTANRELGTVHGIDQDGRLSLKMDAGRDLQFDPRLHPHLDHGYAVTSHSSQGKPQTAC